MGQELLEINYGYVRKPRKYFLGVASNGARILRGSADRDYSHAVISTQTNYKNQITWGTFHSTEQLAKRQLTTSRNYEAQRPSGRTYELVTLTTITAKEARAIKKLDSDNHKKHLEFLLGVNREARSPINEGVSA